MRQDAHPTLPDARVLFDEDAHAYTLTFLWDGYPGGKPDTANPDAGERVPSVTQFVHHYAPVFDERGVAAKAAAKRGVEPEQVLAEWRARREYACDFGTRVHANQEAMLNGLPPPNMPKDDREKAVMSAGWRAVQDILTAGWTRLYAEKMVASWKYKLAGTVDVVLARKGQYFIIDWKTNERIDERNRFGGRMLAPIQELDDCNLTHYSLQLNLYRKLLIEEGYLTGVGIVRMALVHLTPNGYRLIDIPFTHYADTLLTDYLTGGWHATDDNLPF